VDGIHVIKENVVMADIIDMKISKTKRPLVWIYDDQPEDVIKDIVETVQNAQQVVILRKNGSLVAGNTTDGFDTLVGDENQPFRISF
jgi:hypothetical protein